MDSGHRNKRARYDIVIQSEEDEGEIRRTQSHDFITQLCINLESANIPPPQATVVPHRPTMIEKSNHCWKKLHLREISSNPTVSNKCKQMNLFRDFHVQQFDTHITKVCISDRNLFMKSYNANSVLIFDRETNRVINRLNMREGIFCFSFCYNEHDDSLVMVNNAAAAGREELLETVPIESFYQQELVQLTGHLQADLGKSDFDFDIPNCKGIFYKQAQRQFKVFELKNYNILYTIQCEFEGAMVHGFHRSENSTIALYHREIPRKIRLILFSKEDGHFINNVTASPIHSIPIPNLVTICSDTEILLYQEDQKMVSVDISYPSNPQVRQTNVMALWEPIVVPKNRQVVVRTLHQTYEIITFHGMSLFKIPERVRCAIPCLSQNLLILACEDMRKFDHPDRERNGGPRCIKAYDLVNGKLLGAIYEDDPNVFDAEERRNRRATLLEIYHINYDPKTCQIFTITGGGQNQLGIWSNK